MKKQFIQLLTIVLVIAGASLTASAADQTRSVSGFNAIASSGAFNVHVKIDGTESLKINAPDDIINEIVTEVDHGTLKIKYKNDDFWEDHHGNEKVDVYITAKALATLINSGSGSINVDGTVNTSKFKAVLSGSGSITTSVKADEMSAAISGSGSMRLQGSINEASISVTGSGSLYGKGLETKTSSIAVAGSGNVYIGAEKELSAHIVGSGSVKYSGNASVSTSKIGSGSVTKVN